VTALAIDAGRTLLFDRPQLIALADAKNIAVQAFSPPVPEPKGSNKGMNQE